MPRIEIIYKSLRSSFLYIEPVAGNEEEELDSTKT